MQYLEHLFSFILHIDVYLFSLVSNYGAYAYALLFVIIFCETGLVVTPFLPGDSLLFAAGSIAANAENFSFKLLFVLLVIASILGNKVNYLIGRFFGIKLFKNTSRWFNQNHLTVAHRFYEKHGGVTLLIGRFLPIIRTFAPFVAGMATMSMQKFTLYNILGALIWVGSLLSAGYFLGSLAFFKDNFSMVIYGIIAISLIPPILVFGYKKICVYPDKMK